jgi:hypothetical protein
MKPPRRHRVQFILVEGLIAGAVLGQKRTRRARRDKKRWEALCPFLPFLSVFVFQKAFQTARRPENELTLPAVTGLKSVELSFCGLFAPAQSRALGH